MSETPHIEQFKTHLVELDRLALRNLYQQRTQNALDFSEQVIVPALEQIGAQ